MNARPKVAHLTSVHQASDTRIAHKECATLARAGYDVVVVAPGKGGDLPEGVRHHAVALPKGRLVRFTRTLWQIYRAARAERAQIYHFHDPELIGVGAALRLSGARVIFDVHEDLQLDIETKPWIPRRFRRIVGRAAATALRVAQHWFSAIVPATPSIASAFDHGRVMVVRNYPRAGDLLSDEAPPYERRPNVAIYAGSITAVRGVEQMIRAIGHPSLPETARLTLAGSFEDQTLRLRAGMLPGWSRVHAPGHLRRRELAAAMAQARIGLLLLLPAESFVRSLPTKLYEYMSVGLPVIASKFIDECRDVVDRYGCGILVDPRDVDEIATAMSRAFRNPDEAQAMGERGRTAMRRRFEWSTEGEALVGLYADVAS